MDWANTVGPHTARSTMAVQAVSEGVACPREGGERLPRGSHPRRGTFRLRLRRGGPGSVGFADVSGAGGWEVLGGG